MANYGLPPSSLLLILMLIIFSNAFILPSAMDCNSSDRAALLKIKEQLGNPPELSSWLPATNCCAWELPILCSEIGRVTLVSLSGLNVTASIPSAFGDLPMLSAITLDTMPGLYGTIPSSFSKLSHLRVLDIDGTSITGPLPDFLANTDLYRLTITNSKLTGPIPQSLIRLPNLYHIDLHGNMLSGSIPPGLLHKGTLGSLLLSNNRLTGEIPAYYGNEDIYIIDLSHNQLTGNISFLYAAKMVKIVDLSWNNLEFDMTKVRFPHSLESLDLSHNRIKGKLPKSLKNMDLVHLNVGYNELCGEIPTGEHMERYRAENYAHNKCLCGTPLPPCKKRQ